MICDPVHASQVWPGSRDASQRSGLFYAGELDGHGSVHGGSSTGHCCPVTNEADWDAIPLMTHQLQGRRSFRTPEACPAQGVLRMMVRGDSSTSAVVTVVDAEFMPDCIP